MWPYNTGPIYEPKDSQFRPTGILSLIAFCIGRFVGCLFRR
jgi:hypothetical protein